MISGMQDKYLGGTPKNVKNLFLKAAELKNCIIFVDEVSLQVFSLILICVAFKRELKLEMFKYFSFVWISQHLTYLQCIFQIDSMATDRGETSSSSEKQALFQILIEMNNLKHPDLANVFIICATNDPESLDCAIRRRFTFVHIGAPQSEDRKGLFKYYLNDNHDLSPEDLDLVAKKTDGYSASDIENLVKTAATFFYQEKFREMFRNNQTLPTNSSLPQDGRKISLEELMHCISKSSPTTENHQRYEIESFKQKHNFVSPPPLKNQYKKKSCTDHVCCGRKKKGVFGRLKIWLFGEN